MEDSLIFYAPLDGTIEAAFAKGSPVGTSVLEPRFEKGLRGQALVIGGDPRSRQSIEGDLPVSDKVPCNAVYQAEGNLDILQGTVSMWVKLLDWDGTNDGFNVLFYSHAGENYFQFYKFFSTDELLMLTGGGNRRSKASMRLRDWKRGQWHHLAVSWSSGELCLYHNGHLVCRSRVSLPMDNIARVEPFSIGPGGVWSKAFIGHSLVDEFRIYNRPLNLAEVRSLYLADAADVENLSGRIVLGSRTPEQDGSIKDDAYSFDSTALEAAGQEKISPETSRLALSYDENFFYLAALTLFDSDSAHAAGERIKLSLSPAPGQFFDFEFAPDGGLLLSPENDGTADSLKSKSTLDSGKWLLEAAIPFAALGLTKAPEGSNWRMNVVRRYGSETGTVSFAPIAGSERDRANFIALTFDAAAPAIRIGDSRDYEIGKRSYSTDVLGAASEAEIKVERVTDTTRKYGLYTSSEVLQEKGKYRSAKPITYGISRGTVFSLSEFRVKEILAGHERILYERRSITDVADPLHVHFMYVHDSRQLRVAARHNGDGKIRIRFLQLADGGMAGARESELEDLPEIWRSEQPYPENTAHFTASFDLDFEALKPDLYLVMIEHVADDSKTSLAWQQALVIPGAEHPAFHPYVDPEADKVPEPWTPVVVAAEWQSRDGQDVAVSDTIELATWGRSYRLGGGLLFDSLISQEQELLAGPVKLIINEEVLEPQNVETRLLEKDDLRTVMQRSMSLGNMVVGIRIITHFDGYCEFDLELTPPTEGAEVKSLALEFPLHGDKAEIVRDAYVNDLAGSKAGAVGDYWHQKFDSSRARSFVWVGGGRVGLNLLSKDLENWKTGKDGKNVEMTREADTVTLRLNIIDSAVTFDGPRKYRLGLALTPSRPLDRKILRRREMKEFQMWCQPWQYFGVAEYETASLPLIDHALRRAEPGADEVFLYFAPSISSPFMPEYAWFAEDWLGKDADFGAWTGSSRDPIHRNRGTYSQGVSLEADTYFNWMQHMRATFFEKAKTPLTPEAHSYYFDTGPSVMDRYREQAINVYRMIKRTGPDARVYAHQGWTRAMPYQHFTEIICGGEGVDRVREEGNYYRVLTPEKFRGSFCPYLYGIKMVFIDMTVRLMREESPQKLLRFDYNNPEFRHPLMHSYGYCVVHDVDIHESNLQSKPLREIIWDAQDALEWDEEVEFHSYWENDTVKRLGDDIGRIMASAYTKNGRMILAVLNDTDEEREVELALDLERLGVKAGVQGADAWEPELKYVLDARWSDMLPPRGFLMIVWK